MSGPGKDKLRALIADEVARWSLDHRRGLRPYDLSDPELVAERAYRNLAGYGPLEPLLDDDDVWEVMVNAPDAIFVKRHRGRSGYHDEVFHDDEHVIRILTKILDDASGSHRKLDPSEGLQDAQLDNGARLHIVHGDISRGGHVMVNIRKFTGVAFRHLDQLVERDMLSAPAAALPGRVRARPPDDRVRRSARAPARPRCCPAARRSSILRCGSSSPRRSSRPTSRCRTSRACRPDRPAPDRPAVDLRKLVAGLPPHGARCRDRRGGPRPRGAAAPAHAVVGGEGLHHHPCRLGPPGADPPAVHLPAVGGAPASCRSPRSTRS